MPPQRRPKSQRTVPSSNSEVVKPEIRINELKLREKEILKRLQVAFQRVENILKRKYVISIVKRYLKEICSTSNTNEAQCYRGMRSSILIAYSSLTVRERHELKKVVDLWGIYMSNRTEINTQKEILKRISKEGQTILTKPIKYRRP